jgi:hypothetical protein
MPILSTFLLVFTFLFNAISPGLIQSGDITVSMNEIDIQYPQIIQFKIAAQSDSNIEKVVLHYSTNAASCQGGEAQQVVKLDPAKEVDLKWDWDLKRAGALPPGAQVSWYWEINDASGNMFLTEEQTAEVQDDRHSWDQVTSTDNRILVQWYDGDQEFGGQLLQIAQDSLQRLSQKLGIESDRPLRMIVYPSSEELREVLLTSQEWTGGVARPDFGSVLFGAAPGEVSWLKDVIPHEFAHLLIDELTFNCKGVWLPTWLSEGLAVNSEGDMTFAQHTSVEEGLSAGKLRPLHALENGFSPYGDQARLEYDQAGYVVEYMIEQYGPQKMAGLLKTVQEGNKIDDALLKVYNLDTDGLDTAWRVSLGAEPLPTAKPTADRSKNTPIPTRALPTSIVRVTATVEAEPPSPTPPPPTATSEKSQVTQLDSTSEKILREPSETSVPTIVASEKTTGGFSTIFIILIIGLVVLVVVLLLVVLLISRNRK